MTLHVVYDHQCGKCGASYIPYDADVPCPRCGLIESDRFGFIDEAVKSIRYNKEDGRYRPAAWLVGSLGDQILNIMFDLFDAHEEKHSKNFANFAATWLARYDWGDDQYFNGHLLAIAIRLHEVLKEPAV